MKNNTSISERVVQMIDYLGVNTNDFANKLGYNRSQALYDITNGKSKPSFDFFDRLSNSEFSEIFSLDWIITGKGDMLKIYSKGKETLNDLESHERKLMELEIKGLEKECQLQSCAIDLYKDLNGELKLKIDNLEKEVKELRYVRGEPIIYGNVAEPIPELRESRRK